MFEKSYTKIIIIVSIIGLASILALFVWGATLHNNVSIISYIANKGW